MFVYTSSNYLVSDSCLKLEKENLLQSYIHSIVASLRSKRFGKAFRTFDALFAFWPRENWGGRKKVRGGGGERREGNACTQTPRF